MQQIKLNNGKVALVDDEDYEMLSRFNWTFGLGYAFTKYGIETKSMHQLLLPDDKLQVDHIDGDGLNNQKSNLRLATKSQQQANSKLRKDNTTGYKGVCLNKDKFRASIMINGKSKQIGRYESLEDAARAYDREAKRIYGKFARLNFPETLPPSEVSDADVICK